MKSASAPLLGPIGGPGSVRFPGRPPLLPAPCGEPKFYDPPAADVIYPKEVKNICIGPVDGPGSGTKLPPQRGALAIPTEAPDVVYELPPVEAVKPRTTFSYTLTSGEGRGALPKSLSTSSFINYDGELTHPKMYKPMPQMTHGFVFDKSAQRPEGSTDLTKTSYISQRDICTPCTHKHTRAPARRFGPGQGMAINPRFRPKQDLTKEAYMRDGAPNQQAIKRRNPSAIMTGSVRSTIMDARMESSSCHALMRMF